MGRASEYQTDIQQAYLATSITFLYAMYRRHDLQLPNIVTQPLEVSPVLSRYGLEKLTSSILDLAVSQESLQKRLESAGVFHLCHINIDRDIPTAEMRDHFMRIYTAMTSCKPVQDEGSIAASTAAMNDDEARQHISAIIELCLDIRDYLAVNR